MANIQKTEAQAEKVVNSTDGGKIKNGSNSEESSVAPSKRVRVPLYAQSKFDLEQYGLDTESFFYYFANDIGNNIDKKERAGYEKVIHNKKPVTRARGDHQEGLQYLMRIPRELHEEDMAAKQQIVDEIESDMGKRPKGYENDIYVKKADIKQG